MSTRVSAKTGIKAGSADPRWVLERKRSEWSSRLSAFVRGCEERGAPILYGRQGSTTTDVTLDLVLERHAAFAHTVAYRVAVEEACERAGVDVWCGGIYTTAPRVPNANVVVLLDTLYDIVAFFNDPFLWVGSRPPVYTRFPVYPAPDAAASTLWPRVEAARERGYALAHGVKDHLPLRWELDCEARGCLAVTVFEWRSGLAEVRADWPAEWSVDARLLDRLANALLQDHLGARSRASRYVGARTGSAWTAGSWVPLPVAEMLARLIVQQVTPGEETT